MKEFEFFLRKGDVRRQGKDENTSAATFRESKDRLELAKTLTKPKYTLENAYEAIREAADSLLYIDGYKSYSHEASIVYLLRKGFSESEINEIDRFRKIRNGIKYYGRDCELSDAKSAIKLAEKIISKIGKIHRRKINGWRI